MANSYLNRTPVQQQEQNKFTKSAWVKKSKGI